MARRGDDRDGPSDGGAGQRKGVVREVLPRAMYRVAIEGGHDVTAHVAGGSGRNFVRLVVGDPVLVELMPRDVTRGRVVKRTR
jgi:translation initiation factor IF-1